MMQHEVSRGVRSRRWAGAALALAIASTHSDRALAQSAPNARAVDEAQVLFNEGKRLMESGRLDEACRRFVESQSLDAQVGTALNLAYCYELSRRTASACPIWLGAAEWARQRQQSDRAKLAVQHAEATCSRMMRATIDVAPQPARDRIVVTVDDAPLAPALWGRPVPLDEGTYVVRASAAGRQPWSTTLHVAQSQSAAISIPPLSPEPETARARADATAARPWLRTAGFVSLGIGAAGLGAAAIFDAVALSDKNASNAGSNCLPNNNCNGLGESDRAGAAKNGDIATVAFVVGAAGVATGAALLLFDGLSLRASPGALRVQPLLGRQECALMFAGAWQ